MPVTTRSGKKLASVVPIIRKKKKTPMVVSSSLATINRNLLRKIASILPMKNRASLAASSRMFRNVVSPYIEPPPRINPSNNNNIIRRERELSNIVNRHRLGRTVRGNEGTNINEFIRLANNYYAKYPYANENHEHANINGIRRVARKHPTFFGSGYYKRWANNLRRSQNASSRKIRINTHWTGPFASTNRRTLHYMSVNGKYKFYPYHTREGTLVINGVREKHAKKKYIFRIPGYRY